jgi:hypothetical protein
MSFEKMTLFRELVNGDIAGLIRSGGSLFFAFGDSSVSLIL